MNDFGVRDEDRSSFFFLCKVVPTFLDFVLKKKCGIQIFSNFFYLFASGYIRFFSPLFSMSLYDISMDIDSIGGKLLRVKYFCHLFSYALFVDKEPPRTLTNSMYNYAQLINVNFKWYLSHIYEYTVYLSIYPFVIQ